MTRESGNTEKLTRQGAPDGGGAVLKTERLRAAQEAWIWEAVTPTVALRITAAGSQA